MFIEGQKYNKISYMNPKGNLHRENGPAYISTNKIMFYKNGELNPTKDNPSIIEHDTNTVLKWFKTYTKYGQRPYATKEHPSEITFGRYGNKEIVYMYEGKYIDTERNGYPTYILKYQDNTWKFGIKEPNNMEILYDEETNRIEIYDGGYSITKYDVSIDTIKEWIKDANSTIEKWQKWIDDNVSEYLDELR